MVVHLVFPYDFKSEIHVVGLVELVDWIMLELSCGNLINWMNVLMSWKCWFIGLNIDVRMSGWFMRIEIYLGISYEIECWIKLPLCLNWVYGYGQANGVYMCESMYVNEDVCNEKSGI